MATEATFTVASEAFPLGSVFTDHPDLTVELERVIPTSRAIVPYFWIRGGPIEGVVAACRDHPAIAEIEVIDSVDGQYLVRVEWNFEHEGVLAGLVETEVTLLKGSGDASEWTFTVRGDARTDLVAFQRYCGDRDIQITLCGLHELEPAFSPDYDLTDRQREAMLLAFERGYFDSPREASLEELAGELDLSHQAVASRLRRGTRRLIAGALADEP